MKEWNAQKRKECKRKCKAHVAAHLGSCIGANVLYSLPIILLMLIVYLTMFGSSFALLVAGADESAVAQAMLRGTGSGLFTAVLLLLVVSGPRRPCGESAPVAPGRRKEACPFRAPHAAQSRRWPCHRETRRSGRSRRRFARGT